MPRLYARTATSRSPAASSRTIRIQMARKRVALHSANKAVRSGGATDGGGSATDTVRQAHPARMASPSTTTAGASRNHIDLNRAGGAIMTRDGLLSTR